jgi:hypothetical protein
VSECVCVVGGLLYDSPLLLLFLFILFSFSCDSVFVFYFSASSSKRYKLHSSFLIASHIQVNGSR